MKLAGISPTLTLLDYLRLTERRPAPRKAAPKGTAAPARSCSALARRALVYEPVNACILFLAQVDGTEIVTVEDLAPRTATLHPVQQAMVENHGSQCGFCTPGFVMALFALYHRADAGR